MKYLSGLLLMLVTCGVSAGVEGDSPLVVRTADGQCFREQIEMLEGHPVVTWLFWKTVTGCDTPSDPIQINTLVPASTIEYFLDQSERILAAATQLKPAAADALALGNARLRTIDVNYLPPKDNVFYQLRYSLSDCRGIAVYVSLDATLEVVEAYEIKC